jgi:protein involved in polysaccharide export with SLBB domain
MINAVTLLLIGLLAVQTTVPATPGQAQPPAAVTAQVPAGPTPLPSALPNESAQLGPGDVVQVTVWTGNELLQQSLTLAADGTILIPFLVNKLVKVSGLTSIELRSLLEQELRKNYLNPVVQVIQNTVQSKRALLVTDVGLRSGYYPINGDTTALDFIIANGGYAVGANLVDVQITHASGQKIHTNLFNALVGNDTSGNIKLLPNDTVFVPSLQTVSNKIFVISEGRTVNLLQVQDRITLLEALARSGAGGSAITNTRVSDLAVIRYDPVKKVTNVKEIKFSDIYAKKADLSVNVLLENGDIVYLPKSRLARTAEIVGVLTPMLGFVQQTIFFKAAFQ